MSERVLTMLQWLIVKWRRRHDVIGGYRVVVRRISDRHIFHDSWHACREDATSARVQLHSMFYRDANRVRWRYGGRPLVRFESWVETIIQSKP